MTSATHRDTPRRIAGAVQYRGAFLWEQPGELQLRTSARWTEGKAGRVVRTKDLQQVLDGGLTIPSSLGHIEVLKHSDQE